MEIGSIDWISWRTWCHETRVWHWAMVCRWEGEFLPVADFHRLSHWHVITSSLHIWFEIQKVCRWSTFCILLQVGCLPSTQEKLMRNLQSTASRRTLHIHHEWWTDIACIVSQLLDKNIFRYLSEILLQYYVQYTDCHQMSPISLYQHAFCQSWFLSMMLILFLSCLALLSA